MAVTDQNRTTAKSYLYRKTLITGAVNSGKTRRTLAIVDGLCLDGHAPQIVLLDLAPETSSGIGGKMGLSHSDILILSEAIHAPRLTGRNEAHIVELARQNAQAIEPLLERALRSRRTILVINDASLYLQAGSLEHFLEVIGAFPTVLINAYCGHSFVPAPFTRIERDGVMALARVCDQVIEL